MPFLLLPLSRSDLAVSVLLFLSSPFRVHTGHRGGGRLALGPARLPGRRPERPTRAPTPALLTLTSTRRRGPRSSSQPRVGAGGGLASPRRGGGFKALVGGGDNEIKATVTTLQTPASFFSPAPLPLVKRLTQSDLQGTLERGTPFPRGRLSLAEPVSSTRGAGGCVCTYVYICT